MGEPVLSAKFPLMVNELKKMRELQPDLKLLLSFGGPEYFAKYMHVFDRVKYNALLT